MPQGANSKREREYEELKTRFKREHRYPGRGTQVAARIVNKQRRKFGETKKEKARDAAGRSPDQSLPIDRYQHLTAPQVNRAVSGLTKKKLQQVRRHEAAHKGRKTVLARIDRQLQLT